MRKRRRRGRSVLQCPTRPSRKYRRPERFALANLRNDATLGREGWTARDIAFCLLTLLLLRAARRAGAPCGWLALGVAIVLLPLGSGSFASDARFALLALPAYWGLAWLCRDRRVFTAVATVSACLLVAATITLPLVFP